MNTLEAFIRDGLSATAFATMPAVEPVTGLRDVWIAIRTDGVSPIDMSADPVIVGDGTRGNPWDGSTAYKLDFILRRKLFEVENVTIHLGPGIFRTGGAHAGTAYEKWRPRSGWKIIGSGQYQTTLLLTIYGQTTEINGNGTYPYWMIFSNDRFLDGFELCDLTLDCGMDDQPMPPDAKYLCSPSSTKIVSRSSRLTINAVMEHCCVRSTWRLPAI